MDEKTTEKTVQVQTVDTQPEEAPEEKETIERMDSLESYEKSFEPLRRGQYVTGKIVKVDAVEAIVDIGYKSEGVIPLQELTHRNITHPSEEVKVGDEVKILNP